MIRTEEIREKLQSCKVTKEQICENCRFSKGVWGLKEATLICENPSTPCGRSIRLAMLAHGKQGRQARAGKWCIAVDDDDSCGNFEYSRDIVSPENAAALVEGAKLIPLTQDKFAIVDAEDYERLARHKWHVSKSHNSEYAVRCPGRKRILMHRLLLNAPGGLVVDHRDGNGLNNRKGNLRLCTHQENSYNQRPRRGGTSRFRGVCWKKTIRKYAAKIQKNGKRYYLGYFADEIEAAVVYDIKAMELFGEFAYFNFPDLMQRYKLVNSE